MTTLATAVAHARRIRRKLLESFGPEEDLMGYCAQASLLLASALGNVTSLRLTLDKRSLTGHVWNVVDGHIIDITASQFDEMKDVLVTAKPRRYHRPVTSRGAATFVEILDDNWLMNRFCPDVQDAIRTLCAKRNIEVPADYRLRSAS